MFPVTHLVKDTQADRLPDLLRPQTIECLYNRQLPASPHTHTHTQVACVWVGVYAETIRSLYFQLILSSKAYTVLIEKTFLCNIK